MSILKAVKKAMSSHGQTVGVNYAIAEKATNAETATQAIRTATTALNKATRLSKYGFGDAALDWSAVAVVVDRIGAVKLGIHEARKLKDLRACVASKALVSAESKLNIPILCALSEGDEVSVAHMRNVGNDNNQETFLTMLSKASLIKTRKEGRSKVAYSVLRSSDENRLFWQAMDSLCK